MSIKINHGAKGGVINNVNLGFQSVCGVHVRLMLTVNHSLMNYTEYAMHRGVLTTILIISLTDLQNVKPITKENEWKENLIRDCVMSFVDFCIN